MGELLSAINYLCKLLNNVIDSALKPEFFRLSKMNKLNLEETMQFWNILHNLCCFSSSGSCENNAVECVTRFLLNKGTVIAYILPPEATPRQLLLCFGWFMSNGIIESIIDKIILATPLGKELHFKPDESIKAEIVSRPLENLPEHQLNYAMFLSGRIQHNLRAISNHRQERAHLLAKLHKVTAGTGGLPHLSAGEVSLLSRPESMTDFLTQCQHCVTVLETYSKWQKRSPVFWQWMDSVLREEEISKLHDQLSDRELHHLTEFSKTLENNVRRIARLEDEDIAEDEFPYLFIGKMQLRKDGKFLEKAIDMLDSKIEIFSKISERKKQELEIQLSNKENSSKLVEEIKRILIQFGFDLQQDVEFQSKVQSSIAAIEAKTKVPLDKYKPT